MSPKPHPELHESRPWLDGFRRGEKDALEQVFRAYVGYVAAVHAGGITLPSGGHTPGVDHATQQELIQETFLKAFAPAAREAYDGLRPYAPYLARIARNVLVDHHRRSSAQKRTGEMVELEDAGPLPADQPPPDRVAIDAQRREQVQAFLATLPSEDREFVRLRFEEGLGQAQVAQTLGITRHRVRSLDRRLIDALRIHLKGS